MKPEVQRTGRVSGINGNMITVKTNGAVMQNEVAFVGTHLAHPLKGEVIRIRENTAELQLFEDPTGLCAGDPVTFSGELLSVELGPGILSSIFDGLQNPLPELAAQCGFFLQRGVYLQALDRERTWPFTPTAKKGDSVKPGDVLATVPEGACTHSIMVPFAWSGHWSVDSIKPAGNVTVDTEIAVLISGSGERRSVTLMQRWPVKIPLALYKERLRPDQPLVTQIRIIDALFPVARGGTYCIPGPFGAGKTVLQQLTSRYADVDVVVIAACGERAGEVVDTLREFPELTDPRTGRSLMERTVIICNTSSMPVAAREASVYTAITLAEYYRQMGLHVLLLADSTSRWAQALRELSGRLEEIPGEEAFPAYLESVIAAFYERAGLVRLHSGKLGSITIGGTVSPAGGNMEEPVTQSTLKVTGAFHGLSRERSDARRYPAIDPLDSWSNYNGLLDAAERAWADGLLRTGTGIQQMMKVVGEEGTSLEDIVRFLKAEYFDAVFLQQNAFHKVDSATPPERLKTVFSTLRSWLERPQAFSSADQARRFFQTATQQTRDWNRIPLASPDFESAREQLTRRFTGADHA